MSRPLVVAHRCGSGVAPENTLAALRTAVREGADAVEVDVLPSRDGHPVVHHDDRLSRTAGIDAAVWEVDLADLRALDVGRWFAPGFEGERIPTLEDVVAALPAGVRLVADFKHGEERFPGFAARVADMAPYLEYCGYPVWPAPDAAVAGSLSDGSVSRNNAHDDRARIGTASA